MIKRLRVKFVCINMTLVVALLLAILVLMYHMTAVNLENDSISSLKAASGSQFLPGRPGSGMSRLTFVLQEQPDGSVLVIGGTYFDLSDEGLVADIHIKAQKMNQQIGVLESYSLRFYREEGHLGTRYSFVDISAEQAALKSLLTTCVMIGLGSFAGFLAVSILLARWAIRPVEKAWEQQRQFVADASHELKTPLTVILTNAELLQSADYTPEDKQKFTGSILDVSRQMRGLVEAMLQLARADRGQQKTAMVKLDLSALTENALLPFEPVYFERELVLDSRIEPGIFVMGDEAALRQAVGILLDNGQKYAVHGTAEMTLCRQGKKAVLRFFTPGKPLTPEQCKDIFKRFYRVDEARTMSGSYGLGLSIAQNIAEAHGGRIWAESSPEGNTFCITLPEA